MTAVAEPSADVLVANRDDLKKAIDNALRRAECTFDELAEQARTGNYASTRARLAWMAIGDLYGVVL
ncbi:hypothetical protein K3U93_19250 [Mycobacterium malmoense]|uniref:HNH endonuclease n=2 Tax=Mycobacterium malmoense TaxID=1780 RepID=A0ABX3SKQ7_MYCMA|nr:hypothetical protein [Mycobacterium malmoense]OIN78990.1 hypothetical protein BMG05_20280 [Mycobacterium malmoense]ORA77663.1 hypothetical protein BST29_23050 [Mycobacterium malmoense]QZA20225.1 hypothetical protein K3U93_19250 [Mycobacterium malmoense]UNB96981.1 hypothetical protein H5T25_19230 [Mycobacterium malmoense]